MAELTERQREIKERLERGMGARAIADDLGITRNAVYQQIQRMRRQGSLDAGYTPTGQPPRESMPGEDVLTRLLGKDYAENDGRASAHSIIVLERELRYTRDTLSVIVTRLSGLLPR